MDELSKPPPAMDQWFNDLALTLSDPQLPTKTVIAAYDQIKGIADLSEELQAGLRKRVLEILTSPVGSRSPTGTLSMNLDGWHVEARAMSDAPNAKKLEALLRAKGLQPELHMETTVSYKVDSGKLAYLVTQGKITDEEIDSCRPAKNYALQRPTKIGDGG